jgi:CelD/BcsL family acetyltransferase involved in cellulose biosynthesis
VKVRLVTSLREFDALAPIWREVAGESGQASPFLSHDWFACCWRTAGPNRGREVWVVEDSAGPVALVPLVREVARVRGLPVRLLSFLDSPDTPFADFLLAAQADRVVAAFLEALRGRRDWDLLSLARMPGDSMTLKGLKALLPGQFPWRAARKEFSPYLMISGGWEEFFRQKTQRFRKTVRNIENRIRRGGAVTVEEHRDVDPDGPVFAEAMEVSSQSWKGSRGLAIATMQGMPRFFRELTPRASANGWLHLMILRLDGRAIATEYQLGADGRRHALRADFDSSLAEISPGAYLNQRIIRTLFEQGGVHEYDMGPGMNEYKLRWASGAHEAVGLEVYAPTTYGRLLHTIETRLIPVARRLRSRARSA